MPAILAEVRHFCARLVLLFVNRVVAFVCLLPFVLVSLAFSQDQTGPAGTWRSAAPAPTKRTEVTAAAVQGKVYLVGGFSEPTLGNLLTLTVTPAVEEYDPATDRWTTKAPLPIGLHHAGAAAVEDRLFVVGGFTPSLFSVWQPVATLYEYHADTDTWTERTPMPTPRGALAVTVYDGKLVAIGGYGTNGNSSAVEVYNPTTDSWSTAAPLPTPRDHLAAATVGKRIFAIGGRLNRDYGRNLAVTEAYDPATQRWVRMADMPTPRSGITAGVLGGWIYVLGGEAREGTFSTNEAYAPEEDRWRTMAAMPSGRHGLGSAVVNDRLYVLSGGPKPGGSYSNLNEMFLPPTTRQSRAAMLSDGPPSPRASSKQVGTVMALLAAFQDAGTLPPESSPEANQLIRALIQFQAAFMKSPNPAVRRFLARALTAKLGAEAPAALEAFRTSGWTSQTLEAVVDYVAVEPVWDNSDLQEGFLAFNVGSQDFDLLAKVFRSARTKLLASGEDLHQVYETRRRTMPGGGL